MKVEAVKIMVVQIWRDKNDISQNGGVENAILQSEVVTKHINTKYTSNKQFKLHEFVYSSKKEWK